MKNRYGLRVFGHQVKDGPKVPLRVHNSQFNFSAGVGDFRFVDDWVDDTDKAHSKPRSLDKLVNGKLYPAPISPDRAKLLALSIEAHKPLISRHTALRPIPGMEDVDCVLVGPGPSSAGIAERLQKLQASGKLHRNMAVVALNRAGMMPDLHPSFFMCLDAHSREEWWRGLDPNVTALITCPMAPPELAKYWEPKLNQRPNCHYFYLRDCGQCDHPAFEPLPMLSGVYSVSTVAIHAMCVMGFKRIFMVGMDLSCAVDPEKKEGGNIDVIMYGDGLKGSKTYMNGAMMIETVGLDGELCLAETQFFQQREAMKVQMEQAWESGVQVYNCSGRGILDAWAFGLEDGLIRPLEATQCQEATQTLPTRTATVSGAPFNPSAPK